MTTNVIHLVDDVSWVNYGVWHAAINTAEILRRKHGVRSHLCIVNAKSSEIPKTVIDIVESARILPSFGHLRQWIASQNTSPKNSLVVSHGAWRRPTRWARRLRRAGFRWVPTPQGMLEPWSMKQKRLRKWLYFQTCERPALAGSDVIRAVSRPEAETLRALFGAEKVSMIPNGLSAPSAPLLREAKFSRFLFLGRLHHKKGVLGLAAAFSRSSLANREDAELLIVGPDDGEQIQIERLIKSSGVRNIQLLGSVFGEDKQRLLQSADFYVLPSFSEGFPTSVVEAMGHGCIPMISQGCNFPEARGAGLTIDISTEPCSIIEGLEQAVRMSPEQRRQLSLASSKFIASHYTTDHVAEQLWTVYQSLLAAPKTR